MNIEQELIKAIERNTEALLISSMKPCRWNWPLFIAA